MTSYSSEIFFALDTTIIQARPYSFLDVNSLPIFEPFKRKSIPKMIAISIDKPLDPSSIVYDTLPMTKLPIGELHYITSLNILCAYLIITPNYNVSTHFNYCLVYRPDTEKKIYFEGTKLIHQNTNLNMFWSEDGVFMASFINKPFLFDAAFLRGGH